MSFKIENLILAVILLLGLNSCGGCGGGGGGASAPALTLSSLEIQGSSSVLEIDSTMTIQATLLDQKGAPFSGASLSWVSDNPGIASVDSNGLVTGVAEGKAHISASSGQIFSNVIELRIGTQKFVYRTGTTAAKLGDVLLFSLNEPDLPVAIAADPNQVEVPFLRLADGRTLITVAADFDPATQKDIFLADGLGATLPIVSSPADETPLGVIQDAGVTARVLYQRKDPVTGDVGIYLINVDGSGGVEISNDPSKDDLYWGLLKSSTLTRVLFQRKDIASGDQEIFVVNLDGSQLTPRTAKGGFNLIEILTPEGLLVYSHTFGLDRDLYVLQVDSPGIENGLGITSDEENFHSLTFDGRALCSRKIAGQRDLFVIRLDGSGEIPLANRPQEEQFKGVLVLGDGGRLVYEIDQGAGQTDLFSVKFDGSGRQALAQSADPEHFVAFSGEKRVLFSVDRGGNAELATIAIDGTGLNVIAASPDSEYFEGFAASQGFRVILFSRQSGADRKLLGKVDGLGPEFLLVDRPGINKFLTLLPGSRIAYQNFDAGNFGIGVVGVDGSQEKLLTPPGIFVFQQLISFP